MQINVVELFAGVGGFRLGLERCSENYKIIWANQWEPIQKSQSAFECYCKHYGDNPCHVNQDIAKVKLDIPDHMLLVGGFPCQDYSIANTNTRGIDGQKGALWWEIRDILCAKRPPYVLLENVDRLLKSPSNQRGRDFGIILRCFHDLGYALEWRVINAADYGYAQRRRRVFLFAFQESTPLFNLLKGKAESPTDDHLHEWLHKDGFFAPKFPAETICSHQKCSDIQITKNDYIDYSSIYDRFSADFFNAGLLIGGRIYSEELFPVLYNPTTLRQIRLTGNVDEKYFLNASLDKWIYLKGAKNIERKKPNGEIYHYSEGNICFPENLDMPSRTILTSEASVSRCTHVIEDAVTGRLRLLTPTECERLNGFPDNWTNTGMSEKSRYFAMGNALVVPLITRIGHRILEIIQ